MNAHLPRFYRLGLILGVVSLLSLGDCARAGMVLTAAGTADGFSLSTFASGFPTGGVFNGTAGPIGIAFESGGGVLVSDVTGNVRLFAHDVDGQTASSAPIGQNYGFLESVP